MQFVPLSNVTYESSQVPTYLSSNIKTQLCMQIVR